MFSIYFYNYIHVKNLTAYKERELTEKSAPVVFSSTNWNFHIWVTVLPYYKS